MGFDMGIPSVMGVVKAPPRAGNDVQMAQTALAANETTAPCL